MRLSCSSVLRTRKKGSWRYTEVRLHARHSVDDWSSMDSWMLYSVDRPSMQSCDGTGLFGMSWGCCLDACGRCSFAWGLFYILELTMLLCSSVVQVQRWDSLSV